MAGKKRLGFRPIDRFEGAKAAADWAMAARGYQPCLDRFQRSAMSQVDSDVIVRLYTQHESRNTEHGGVSVGLSKAELLRPEWSAYVAAQIALALSRTQPT